jgi:biofilm PGA synthesis lipoprotein PgaB
MNYSTGLMLRILLGFSALCSAGLWSVGLQAKDPGAVILQYHHVATTTPAATSISPAQFEQHLDYIAEHGYKVWPITRLMTAIEQDQTLPENVLVISFDDAYPSIYANAFPLLKARGWPFTVFVSTAYISETPGQYLTWSQLQEMQSAGATIGNHTHDHPHLLRRLANESTGAWQRRVTDQIERAQDLLTSRLGTSSRLFAYPYGEYDHKLEKLVEGLGFIAFGQQSGAVAPGSDLRALPRFPLSGNYSGLDSMHTKLQTWPLPLAAVAAQGQDPLLDPKNTRPTLDLVFNDATLALEKLVCYGPDGPTNMTRISSTHYRAQSATPLPVGRSRYNCTLPVNQSERFYWYSQLWILRHPDGSWYAEP